MSSIEKLSIRGVRSFSPHTQNVIEFFTPLTIIVGHNGAGKTTIIECLKYATTGDLPPNSKGGAFVNDPKLSRETEVKAQIKLKFRNAKGAQMIVTRSLQSTQKRNKLEQKTLEGLLATVDPFTGEQVSVSSRCAELDAEIPAQLGVSQAVLENVIFCHQEDSFWPLSEPSVLKKKFDDIFSATRYTKALDTVKGIRKDLATDLKMEQQKLDFFRADVDKATRLQENIMSSEARVVEVQQQASSLDLQIEAVNATVVRLQDDLTALGAIQAELERFQHEIRMAEQASSDLEANTRVMGDSEEELRSILAMHSSKARASEHEIARLQADLQTHASRSDSLSLQLGRLSADLGIIEAERMVLSEREAERAKALDVILERLELSPMSVDGFASSLAVADAAFSSKSAKLQAALEEKNVKERAMGEALQRLAGRQSSMDESRKTRRRQLDDNRASIVQVMDSLNEISSTDGNVVGDLQRRVAEEEQSFIDAQTSSKSSDLHLSLQKLQAQKVEQEALLARLGQQLSKQGAIVDLRAKWDLKRADRERKDDIHAKLLVEVRSMNSGISSAESAEHDADALVKHAQAELQIANERLAHIKQEAAGVQWRRDALLEANRKMQDDIYIKIMRIGEVNVHDRIIEVHAKLSERDGATLKAHYEALGSALRRTHACPTCERSCGSGGEESRLALKIQSMIDGLGREDFALLERELEFLRSLQADQLEVNRLQELIRANLEQTSALADELHVVEGSRDDIESEVSECALKERRVMSLKKKVDEMTRLGKEITALAIELAFMEQKMAISGGPVSADQLQGDHEDAQRGLRRVQEAIDAVTMQIRQQDDHIALLEKRAYAVREELMRVQLKQAEWHRLERKREDLESVNASLVAESKAADTELDDLSKQISKKQSEVNDFVKKADENIFNLQSVVAECERLFGSLRAIHQDVVRLSERCRPERELELRASSKELHLQIQECQDAIRCLNTTIASSSKNASEVQLLERTIGDNLRIRELHRRVAELNAKSSLLESRVGAFDRHGCQSQLQRHQLRHSDLMAERAGLMGELRQLQEQVKRGQREMETEYPNTHLAFRQQFIKVRSTAIAIDDLEKYGRALDQAIMKYHTLKMDEINKIIREIWTGTYQGSDIDTIEIRADHDPTAGARSYNYRVVMVKGEVELDLRGRSSAGQRVLSSLIIRLALAESFGQHCGILALDEPTTNLDHANIEALANALAQIIAHRRAQSNFQLIIITHDEEFVQLLGHQECADYYWRVFKDEGQHSVIERQSIRSNIN